MKKFLSFLQNRNLASSLWKGICWLVTTLVTTFIGQALSDWTVFIYLSAITAVVLIVFIIMYSKNAHKFDLLKVLQQEEKKGNWIEIIRIGYPMCRPLRLSGRYELRLEIGYMLEKATKNYHGMIKIGKETVATDYILASVLIDDIGWNYYEINPLDLNMQQEACNNIAEGLKIAQDNHYLDLVVKAKRNLFDMLKPSDDTALASINELDQLMNEILQNTNYPDSTLEMQAGIAYSKAKYYERQKDFVSSIDYGEVAQALYLKNEDYDRYVKIYHLIGRIYITQKQYDKAYQLLSKGADEAKTWQRKERYIKIVVLLIKANTELLATTPKIGTRFQQYQETIQSHYQEAVAIAKEVHNNEFLRELMDTYNDWKKAYIRYSIF